jgi:hypothetical protein
LEAAILTTSKKKKIAVLPSDLWACGRYRIIDPYTKLSEMDIPGLEFHMVLDQLNLIQNANMCAAFLAQFDAVIVQRVADPALLAVLMALQKYGKKIFMDVDDDLFNVSTFSPAYNVWKKGGQAVKAFSAAVRMVDALFVSTPELVDAYKHLNRNIHVFRNAIDCDDPKFSNENYLRAKLPTDKTVVMWAGSSTHLDSLDEICREIRQVFDSRPDAVFALCGNKEFLDMFTIKDEQKIYIPHVPIDEFYNIPSHADIGLAPVKLNKFNDGKSELKCLEYGIWGIPTLCSPAAPYQRFNEVSIHGNVLTKKNKTQDWCRKLASLIDLPEYRRITGIKAYTAVKNNYNLKDVNQERIAFFEKTLLT